MTDNASPVIMDWGRRGARLRIELEQVADQPPWVFAASILVEAHPWSGTLETLFVREDLIEWAVGLRGSAPRTITLGGGRASELVMVVEDPIPPSGDEVVLTVEVVRSGDDPLPFLRFQVWDVPRDFGTRIADAVRALAG